MVNLYQIKPSPGKGLGVFTRKAIKPGTIIMQNKRNVTAATAPDISSKPEDDTLSEPLSRINHSCDPNVELALEGGETFVVALKAIAKGEEIFVTYLGEMKDGTKKYRQLILKGVYGFRCECPTCCLVGEKATVSDMRRHLIRVLYYRTRGFEVEPDCLVDPPAGVISEYGSKILQVKENVIKPPLGPQEKVLANYLLAKLMEAEGQVNSTLANAYKDAAMNLMHQLENDVMQYILIIPAFDNILGWINVAANVVKQVRWAGSSEIKKVEYIQAMTYNSPTMYLVTQYKARHGSALYAATLDDVGPQKLLTREECKKEVRKRKREATAKKAA